MGVPKGSENGKVLDRSTSIKDELEVLSKGTYLLKIRNKGLRGVKIFKRKFWLDIADLRIVYNPARANNLKKRACVKGEYGNVIDIADIAEVRAGHATDTFNAVEKLSGGGRITPLIDGYSLPKDRSFSLIFKDPGRETLDLVSDDSTIRNMWVDAVTHLVATISSLGSQKEYELYLKKQFQKADSNGNGHLNFDEVRDLIYSLNMKMDKDELRELFNKANEKRGSYQDRQGLDENEFVSFYYSLLQRPELVEVFQKYTKGNDDGKMTAQNLLDFHMKEQKVELLLKECEKIIRAFEPTPNAKTMSIDGFTHFMMFSDLQSITDAAHTKLIYQDMTKPLSHYWIESSHNTYLLGNQVTGESSVDAYVNALKKGCRCVELDCWDGEDGEPIIYHGWTLTTKIPFKDVLTDAIVKYAFHKTDYPLILSIENHCSLPQQDKMADYMKTILKDYIYTEKVDDDEDALPSPEDLKRKILIKAKRLPPGKTQEEDLDESEDEEDERDEKKRTKIKKISQKLSDCVNYIHAVHFHGFDDSAKNAKYYHMSSFGESKSDKIVEDENSGRDFVKYNSRQISRIYPSGKRQDSSNLQPILYWNAGCQIVALNYQTDDKQNTINRALFSDNGGCGYVLKPAFLRDPDGQYSVTSPANLDRDRYPRWTVDLKVLSGQHIPRPKGRDEGEVIDPYVKVKIRGHNDDYHDSNRGETEYVRNNGFNPVWKNNSFRFKVKVPQLAFLELRVKDHSKSGKDDDIAVYCAPLRLLKEGYRRVPLVDYSGKSLSPASLLVHISLNVEDY